MEGAKDSLGHEHGISVHEHDIPLDIPENDEIMYLEQGSEPRRILTPPPRIAARFRRQSDIRRRVSASSSRRNSLSSAHSRQTPTSNRSHHGRPQSNTVAQHLRRTSILEDRKARLADRAAHVEQVRCRAALARAATRSTLKSEERALAAQQAREKNLAEIVARCGEEVKRVRQIAKSMKEKSEADNTKLRTIIQERSIEAQKRREDHLNKAIAKRERASSGARDSTSRHRRSLSPVPVPTKLVSREMAAVRIQKRWRAYKRHVLLDNFMALGLSIEGVRDMTFEDVMQLLEQEHVLVSTACILRMCGLREGTVESADEMTAVRTFLSAYLILGHPTQALNSKTGDDVQEQVGVVAPAPRDDLANPQLQDLVAKAGELLIAFEYILSRVSATNNGTTLLYCSKTLSESYTTFYKAFIAWKARDSSALVDMMVAQFVELNSILQTVKNSNTEEVVIASYCEGIKQNQTTLIVRIKRLAGPVEGMRLIKTALQASRRARTHRPAAERRVRKLDGLAGARVSQNSQPSDLAGSRKIESSALRDSTTPFVPKGLASGGDQEQIRTIQSIIPDNRTCLHEMAINGRYEIARRDYAQRQSSGRIEMLSNMRRDVAAGRGEQWVLILANMIKAHLQKCMPTGSSLFTVIEDHLDTELIAQQLGRGNFSYQELFISVASIMLNLCAEARDSEVKVMQERLLQDADVVDKVEMLFSYIDILQLDYMNYHLNCHAPEMIKYAAAYEYREFKEALDSGRHTLSQTEACWLAARNKVLDQTANRDPEGINVSRNRPSPDRFYAQMLLDVFTNLNDQKPLPETLHLDTKRIQSIRISIRNLITAGAALTHAKNLMKRDSRSQWKVEAHRVLAALEKSSTAIDAAEDVQKALESTRSMPPTVKTRLSSFVRHITESAYANARLVEEEGIAQINEPVMRLLLERLRRYILKKLNATTASEKANATSSFSNLGLSEFATQVEKIVDELSRIGTIDRDAHGQWYEAIERTIQDQASH